MKIRLFFGGAIFMILTPFVQAQRRIDSIRVYYMDLTYLNITPIKPQWIKTYPITKTFLIQDSLTLQEVRSGLKQLKRSAINFSVFDPRVLCEIYTKRRKRTLLISGVKYIHYRGRIFEPSDSLFKILYPQKQS
jgi:hypothetical protein